MNIGVDIKDKDSYKPSNYTIMISNLPRNTDHNELKKGIEWVLNRAKPDIGFEVVDISFGYSIKNFVQDCRDYENLKEKLDKNTRPHVKRCFIFKKPREELEKKKDKLEHKIKEFLKEHKDFKKTNYAFVTFKSVEQKIAVTSYYKMNIFRKLISLIAMCFCINRSNPYKKGNLEVKSAPDPSDIIWHNLSIRPFEKFIRNIISLIIGSAIIGATLITLYCIQMIQIVDNLDDPSGTTEFRMFISLIIMIFNFGLSSVFDLLGKYEGHSSYTSMKNSVIKKSFGFTFSNTVLSFFMIFVIDMIQDKYTKGNPKLPLSIVNWLLSEAIVTPLLLIFDPMYLYTLYRRYKINSNKVNIEQEAANKLYTNPFFPIERRSIQYIRIFSVCLIFSFVFPACLIIAILPIVTCYCTDKYLLLRRYSRSNKYGKKLSLQVISMIYHIVAVYIVRLI